MPNVDDTKTKPVRPPLIGIPPGVELYDTWETKREMHDAGVHMSIQGGIHGTGLYGAESVVMNGDEYENKDHGETFTFIGSGRKDRDQTFDGRAGKFNNALRTSARNGSPVRVIRGSDLPSRYAPLKKGFRFDGLYTVANARLDYLKEGSAHKVCMFDFTRYPGLPPLPVRSEHEQVGLDTDVEIRGAMWRAERRAQEDASNDIAAQMFVQDSPARTLPPERASARSKIGHEMSAEAALVHIETHINHLSQSTSEDAEYRTDLILVIGRAIAKAMHDHAQSFANAALHNAIFGSDSKPDEPMDVEPAANILSSNDAMMLDETPNRLPGTAAFAGGISKDVWEGKLWSYVASRLPADLSDMDGAKLKAWYESAVEPKRS